MNNNNFIFYATWGDALEQMPDPADRAEFLEALVAYGLRGDVIEVKSPLVSGAMLFARRDIDAQRESRAAYIEKQRANGAKGGAPKGNSNAKKKTSETTQNNPNNPPVNKTTQTSPNININIKSNIKEESVKEENGQTPAPRARKVKAFGKYCNVMLTEHDYRSGVQRFGCDAFAKMIEYLSDYKEMTGKEYNNDYVALTTWVVDKYVEEAKKKGINARSMGEAMKKEKEQKEIAEERTAWKKSHDESEANRVPANIVREAMAAGVSVSEYIKQNNIV